MTRENNYKIEIVFNTINPDESIFIGQVPYYGSSSFTDNIEISKNKIIIEAKRSAIIPLDNIFHNHFSSLYNQLLKSLLFYYASTRQFVAIQNINISRRRSVNVLEQRTFNNTQFNQVLDSIFTLNHVIQQDRLKELFLETPRGQSTLVAISYILSANNDLTESLRFEKLWKAFNKLFIQITGEQNDFRCLRKLRTFVESNPNILCLSANTVSTLTKDNLRNSIRWRSMLLDNYDTENKIQALRGFITRYSDNRIMGIILDTGYGYRETFLKSQNLFTEVDTHIQFHINANTTSNNEIVLFLTGKYMYFVRNKKFHGEKLDSAFKLSFNKEDIELKFLNNILERYLIDLINANDKY